MRSEKEIKKLKDEISERLFNENISQERFEQLFDYYDALSYVLEIMGDLKISKEYDV